MILHLFGLSVEVLRQLLSGAPLAQRVGFSPQNRYHPSNWAGVLADNTNVSPGYVAALL